MNFYHIYGIILRYLYFYKKSLDHVFDAFYWPILDLSLWGLTSMYFIEQSPQTSPVLVIIVSAIVFWFIVYRCQYEISGSILEELWNKNLVNIFVSPIQFVEWITAFLCLSLIKGTASFIFGVFIAYLFYKVSILSFGISIIPFVLILILSGWALGMFISGIILRHGSKIQSFAWTLVWAVAPFSAVYYPVSILPVWAQWIAYFLPTTYVFEGLRLFISSSQVSYHLLIPGAFLALLYFILSFVFLKRSFNIVLDQGIVKVH